MTVVNDATRQQLMDKIPNIASGSTCIGCGLETALNVKTYFICPYYTIFLNPIIYYKFKNM